MFLLAGFCLVAQTGSPLKDRLDEIFQDARLSGASVACEVSDLDGKVLYSLNPRTRLLPASNEKVVTTSFALYKLGPNYRCQLSFWKLKKGLFVRATGDPCSRPKLSALSKSALIHVTSPFS